MSSEINSTALAKSKKRKTQRKTPKKPKDPRNYRKLLNGSVSDKRLLDVIRIYNYNQPMGSSNTKKDARDYRKENLEIMQTIIEAEPILPASHLDKLWKQNLTQIVYKAKFPYLLPRDHCFDVGLEDTEFLGCNCKCSSIKRTKIFLEFSVENECTLGRMKILLFNEVVPKTVENFVKLVTNFDRRKRYLNDRLLTEQKSHFVGSRVHRIFPEVFAEMGDIIEGNGLGGSSTTGENFKEENFDLPVNYTGALAMIPVEKGMVSSQFLITFRPLPGLNGKRVVFGRIMKGLRILRHIEGLGRNHGKPIKNIIISDCGVL